MDQKQSTRVVRGRGEAYYRKLLSEQERSGQSLRAFAGERGLSPWTLYGWRVKLGRARPRRRSRRAAPKASRPGFVAVDVVGGAQGVSGIEVVLADGSRVCVPRDTTTERLVELVRALRSC
jgi:hypothetical protein